MINKQTTLRPFKDLRKVDPKQLPKEISLDPVFHAKSTYNRYSEHISNEAALNYDQQYRNILKEFLKLTQKDGFIVDIGCGLGQQVAYLTKRGFKAYGIDISEKAIEIADKTYPQQNFFLGDFSDETIYKKFKVSSVHEHLSLMHLPKNEIEKVFKIIYDALPVKGLLQVSFEEGDPEETGWYSVPISGLVEWEGEKVQAVTFIYLSYFSLGELRETIERAGFKILSIFPHKEESMISPVLTFLGQK